MKNNFLLGHEKYKYELFFNGPYAVDAKILTFKK